jgi:hypothetical protein
MAGEECRELPTTPFRSVQFAVLGSACLSLVFYHIDFQVPDCNRDSRIQLVLSSPGIPGDAEESIRPAENE